MTLRPAAPSPLRPPPQVFLVTELVTGGELLEAVLQRGTYSETEARLAFVQLLRGIQYLHSKCVRGARSCVCVWGGGRQQGQSHQWALACGTTCVCVCV
jgi:serine/threonine protein kinase